MRVRELCSTYPVTYSFVSGIENPADAITRSMSYRTLLKSNYFSGPAFLRGVRSDYESREDLLYVTIPHPATSFESNVSVNLSNVETIKMFDEVRVRCSSFSKLVSVHSFVLKFIQKLKSRLNSKRDEGKVSVLSDYDCRIESYKNIIRQNQRKWFTDIFEYFEKNSLKSEIPKFVSRMNVYLDSDYLLRVKGKFDRTNAKGDKLNFPILLFKDSTLTDLIINDCHLKLNHSGVYSMLQQLRKEFWICHYFSKVKKV